MARDDRKAPPDAPSGGADGADIEVAIDALFQGPAGAFVSERNRLARDLRSRDREAAERVRVLAKPSISAWAVNQAFWHARAPFAAMLEAGEAVRALQQRVMRGEAVEGLAAASARLHEAVGPVARAAQQALEQDGHSASPQLMRRVITTLQAIAAHGRAGTAPSAGRLSVDVDAPGFDLLTALAPAHGPAPHRTRAAPAPATSGHRRESKAETRTTADPEGEPGAEPATKISARPADTDIDADAAAAAGTAQRTAPRGAHRSARGAHRVSGAPRSRQDAQARHAARARVSTASAALVSRQRALAAAERAERAAAERADAAEAAVAAARAALDRATMARDRATQTHEQSQAEADEARAAFGSARDELESAENQALALARDRSVDGHEPT
jgi:hypothetical protein